MDPSADERAVPFPFPFPYKKTWIYPDRLRTAVRKRLFGLPRHAWDRSASGQVNPTHGTHVVRLSLTGACLCCARATCQLQHVSAQHTAAKTSMVLVRVHATWVLNFGCAGISQVRCRLITGRRTKWMDRCASNELTHSLSLSLSVSHSLSLSLSWQQLYRSYLFSTTRFLSEFLCPGVAGGVQYGPCARKLFGTDDL